MPECRAYLRFLWPPGPWREIAGASDYSLATARSRCVDAMAAWMNANQASIRDDYCETVVLEKCDCPPIPGQGK